MARNHVSGLEAFLRCWDGGTEESLARPVSGRCSQMGNLDSDGSAGCQGAPVVARSHPAFLGCIEAGVRDLVIELVERLGYITYSSCEGHRGLPGRVVARERCVGVVPRNAAEQGEIGKRLRRAADETNAAMASQEVAVVIDEVILTSEAATRPCLDLRFACLRSEDGYFGELEPVYRRLLAALRAGSASSPGGVGAWSAGV